jgi:hypothetical protein
MTLRYLPMIWNVAAVEPFFLPLPLGTWDETDAFTNNLVPIVGADGALCTYQRQAPLKFSLQGELNGWPEKPYTPSQMPTCEGYETIVSEFRAAVSGGFWLYRYATQRWENCRCEALTVTPNRRRTSGVYRLEVTCLDPVALECSDEGWESPYGVALRG